MLLALNTEQVPLVKSILSVRWNLNQYGAGAAEYNVTEYDYSASQPNCTLPSRMKLITWSTSLNHATNMLGTVNTCIS